MSTTIQTTAEELLRLPSGEKRYELIRGELIVMSPGNWRHGKIIGEIEYWITRFVKENHFGSVFGAETGFILEHDPDTVRAPDVAVLLSESLSKKPFESAIGPERQILRSKSYRLLTRKSVFKTRRPTGLPAAPGPFGLLTAIIGRSQSTKPTIHRGRFKTTRRSAATTCCQGSRSK